MPLPCMFDLLSDEDPFVFHAGLIVAANQGAKAKDILPELSKRLESLRAEPGKSTETKDAMLSLFIQVKTEKLGTARAFFCYEKPDATPVCDTFHLFPLLKAQAEEKNLMVAILPGGTFKQSEVPALIYGIRDLLLLARSADVKQTVVDPELERRAIGYVQDCIEKDPTQAKSTEAVNGSSPP